ncbi:MAG: LuxR C-terminal-related transcriptional regulator [Pseudomonadota bacterium]
MSKTRLHSEQIYQAMVDDEAFAELPNILAEAVGARSCVIHWRDTRQQAEIMAHSPYFTPDQMREYAEKFVEHDQWSIGGKQRPFINRVWNTKEVVSPSDYQNSIFYNEWIRGMGDDTFHCIGTVMETDRGFGMIGLHRGLGQKDFDAEAIKGLNRNIVHLRRMMTVRARLATDNMRVRGLVALLDANPGPMLAVTAHGRIVHANAAAVRLIEQGAALREAAGYLHAAAFGNEVSLANAIARAADQLSPVASILTITSPGSQRLEITFAPVRDGGRGLVLVSGHDPDSQLREALAPRGAGDALAPRELLVARYVGMGLRNREIAERMAVTEGTVKAYLHNLFVKTGVSTRTELALRIGPQSPR